MSSAKDPTKKTANQPAPPPLAGDVESQTVETGFGVAGIVRRWRREDLLKRGSLALRGLGLLFSLLAFIIMASNKHGPDWENFDKYEEYRYVLAIAILSTVYTAVQALRQVHELSTGKQQIFSQRSLALVDFFGDQIVAYLLVSAASSAVPITNRMREGTDNIFTDSSAAAISMEFLAFLALAFSALVSGYKLSNQSYV
ncbi:uncharacterized protein family [Actinidia rufa]|uniref:CASP-like protein n=1 Tax=Actinidia rufa TaxID=165716 RepID=A0A7J0E7M0_9ERIC|nr:uncharacterized protein family [Actinidia rufa]